MKLEKGSIKEGDVFHARWKSREWGDQKDWCFEGLFVVMIDKDGEKWFVDTYWGVNRWDNKKWEQVDAIKNFELNYYCNLNNIEKIERYEVENYDDAALFRLHDQHSCCQSCIYWYKKKGAKRSPQKKIDVLREKIAEEESNVRWSIQKIKSMSAEIKQLEVEGFKD